MALKRTADTLVAMQEMKRTRNELVPITNNDRALLEVGVRRTSNLFAPIMLLEGHEGEIFSCEFHPEGELLLSTGFDRKIFIWSVYGECENISVMTGHTGAVLEAHFSTDGTNIYTCSTDKTVSIWDVQQACRIRKLKGHTGFVNSVQATRRGATTLASASDDCTIKIWDPRKRYAIHTLDNKYQVTAVCFNDTGDQVITGGIDNVVKVWDMRQNQVLHTLNGHGNTVTGVSLSPDGNYVLSNSMDNTLRLWDIRPYVPIDRCLSIFVGHQHNFERNLLRCCWSKDGSRVSAGSSDRFVYIWDTNTKSIQYKLPGHNGSVNDLAFHPDEPIILSASSDKNLYLGEIDA